MTLLRRERIQGLRYYGGVVLQQRFLVPLQLRDRLLAVLEGCQLSLCCGAGLLQLRQCLIQLRGSVMLPLAASFKYPRRSASTSASLSSHTLVSRSGSP